jgi:hypothetical protein
VWEDALIIYVAGPYTAPTDAGQQANTERAMRAGREILRRGHSPFIPHLTHFFDLWCEREGGQRLPPTLYYEWDLEILRVCDALLYLAPSKGADRELAAAEFLGLTIFRTVDTITNVNR